MQTTQLHDDDFFKVLWNEKARIIGIDWKEATSAMTDEQFNMLPVHHGANAFLIRQALGHKSFDSTLAFVNPSDADDSAALAKSPLAGYKDSRD
jgi:hypothetical protein